MTQNIQNAFGRRDHTLGLFFDLSKVFDTISHPIFLKRLEFYGVQGVYYYRLENGLLSHPLTQILQIKYQHKYNTRHIIQNKCDKKNLKMVGPFIRNSIPQTIRDSRTIAGFKAKV